MNTADRIKLRMQELGLKGVDVTSVIGISSGGVSQWTSGTHKPSGDNLLKLAKLLKCSPEWILGEQDDLEPIDTYPTVEPDSNLARLIPMISWKKAYSIGSNHDNLSKQDVLGWAPAFQTCSSGSFALTVKGDGMVSPYPGDRSYPDGTIIYIDPQKTPKPNQRILTTAPGYDEPLFRTLVLESGKFFLKPLNPQYPMIEVDDDVHIIGVIVGSYFPE